PDADVGADTAHAEHWLVDHVWCDNKLLCLTKGIEAEGLDGATVVDEPFELDHFRDQVQVDRHTVRPNSGFHFQSYTGVLCFKRGGGRGGYREHLRCLPEQSISAGAANFLRNL